MLIIALGLIAAWFVGASVVALWIGRAIRVANESAQPKPTPTHVPEGWT